MGDLFMARAPTTGVDSAIYYIAFDGHLLLIKSSFGKLLHRNISLRRVQQRLLLR